MQSVGGRIVWLSRLTRGSESRADDLAREIYYRLPRELRNHIYAYSVQGSYNNEVIVRRATKPQQAFTLLTRECSGPFSYHWVEDPIRETISTHRLGREVAQEMLEAYYWTRTFKFTHRELPLISTFLETDQYGISMIPAHYARRLQIQIQPSTFLRHQSREARRAEEDRCLRAIESLDIKLTSRIEIAINIEPAEDLEQPFMPIERDELTPKLVHVVQCLKATGMRIDIRSTWLYE